MVIDGGFGAGILAILFQLPRVALLAVHQPRIVVALVQVLENGREDLGFFIGQRDLLVLRVHHLVLEHALEERGSAEDILVGGENPLLLTYDEGDDSGDGVAGVRVGQILHKLDQCDTYGEEAYATLVSDPPAFDTVPARRRVSGARLEMPASLVKDELALRCFCDLEKLLFWGGSNRRENMVMGSRREVRARLSAFLPTPPRSVRKQRRCVDDSGNVGAVRFFGCGATTGGVMRRLQRSGNTIARRPI